MNANELADYLDNSVEAMIMSEQPYIDQAATMLRQQQAEIEVLKKFITESNALDKKLYESIQKANEIWGNATKSILKKV